MKLCPIHGRVARCLIWCLVGSVFVCHLACAQTLPRRWRWSNPLPHGANVFDMAYFDGLTVQVGERGQVFISEDLQNWTPKETGVTNALRAVLFAGSRLVISAEAGTVLYADSLESFHKVSLGTTNWLEGLASSATKLVAVGDNAAIYLCQEPTKPEGMEWEKQSAPNGFTQWLRSVCFGAGKFVAVGENGSIITGNSNGSSWGTANSGVTQHLNRVAYLGNKFWCVGDSGTVLTSDNGAAWTKVTNAGATNHLYTVCGDNSRVLIAGSGEARLSQDGGSSWSDETASTKALPAKRWTYYTSLWEDPVFALSGRSGMVLQGFTTNSTDHVWVQRQDAIRPWLWSVARTPDFYVAVGDRGSIMTSVGGVQWDLELAPDTAIDSVLLGVAGSTNALVAVGSMGTILWSTNSITNLVSTNIDLTTQTNAVSTLGTHWEMVDPSPTSQTLQGAAQGHGLFVVCGAGGVILTSPDGRNWSARSSGTAKYLSSVESHPGGFVAAGDSGTILTSSDGISWSPQTSGATNWVYRVRWLNGGFVAVGEAGLILVSPDAVNWARRTTATSAWLNDVAHVADTYYVAGNQGTILASADTVTWVSPGTSTQKSLYGLASHNGQMVAVGLEGVALRTPLATPLGAVKFLNFNQADAEDVFLIQAPIDQKFTLSYSTNLVDWESGFTYEMLDRSGTFLFRQKSSDINARVGYYRAISIP